MQQGQFDRVVELMSAMAAGHTGAAFELYAEFGPVIRRVLRAHLSDLRATVTDDELDGLVLDAVMALFDAAPAWRADGGAMPWTWAERRLRALVASHVGQWADEFDDHHHDTEAPSGAPAIDGDDAVSLSVIARREPLVALLVEALAEACSERDGQVFIAVKLQAIAGDPSPANTIAAERGLTPVNVRKIASRTRARLLHLAVADAHYAPLAGLPLLAP